MRPRRPEDLYLGRLCAAQPEMQPLIVGGLVAARRGCETSLSIHLHAGAKAVAVAWSAAQRDCQPVCTSATVHKNVGMLTQNGRHHVDPSVVVEIAERRSAPCQQRLSARLGLLETTVMIQGEQRR